MRQMLYKSKETMATESIIADDSNLAALRSNGWKTADEILDIPVTETVNTGKGVDFQINLKDTSPVKVTPPETVSEPASVGIDLDGDDKVDVRVIMPKRRLKKKGRK